jgi:UDP-glucose 4-epimerase
MRIVVTGALGHIGSRLIRELPLAFPEGDMLLIDDLSTQRYSSLFDLPSEGRYQFIETDVLTADLPSLFRNAEVVIHLAAITDATGSFGNKERVEEVNFIGTERVARACATANCALVFPSTTSVYGTQAEVVDEECPITDLKPQSPYADSKLKAENLLQELGKTAGLRYVIARLGTIFGISVGMRFHTAINKFCWQAVMGQPLTVWRTAWEQNRPYLELGDAISAFELIIRRGAYDGGLYNVVTTNTSVRKIVETISEHVPDLVVQYVDTQIMNQLSYHVLNRRFQNLGFEFKGDLAQGIRETVSLLKQANQK